MFESLDSSENCEHNMNEYACTMHTNCCFKYNYLYDIHVYGNNVRSTIVKFQNAW